MVELIRCRTKVHQALATKLKLALVIYVAGTTTQGASSYATTIILEIHLNAQTYHLTLSTLSSPSIFHLCSNLKYLWRDKTLPREDTWIYSEQRYLPEHLNNLPSMPSPVGTSYSALSGMLHKTHGLVSGCIHLGPLSSIQNDAS